MQREGKIEEIDRKFDVIICDGERRETRSGKQAGGETD